MKSVQKFVGRRILKRARIRAAKQGISLDRLVENALAREAKREALRKEKTRKKKVRLQKGPLVPITAMVTPAAKRAIERDARRRGIDINRVIRAALLSDFTELWFALADPVERQLRRNRTDLS